MEKTFGVAVKCLIKNKFGKYLLLHKTVEESKMDNDPSLWDLPGGRLEYGEQIEDAILREVFEETGIKICTSNIIRPLNSVSVLRKDGLHLVVLSYLVEIEDAEVTVSHEHDAYQWISREHKLPAWIRDIMKEDYSLTLM